jgi:hypothetical protein
MVRAGGKIWVCSVMWALRCKSGEAAAVVVGSSPCDGREGRHDIARRRQRFAMWTGCQGPVHRFELNPSKICHLAVEETRGRFITPAAFHVLIERQRATGRCRAPASRACTGREDCPWALPPRRFDSVELATRRPHPRRHPAAQLFPVPAAVGRDESAVGHVLVEIWAARVALGRPV